ncbi:NADPH-dependent 2,4-dienoyl-CoA reductase [Amycolatopsis jejuensis]|uniref:NADPH-dependent 2,4-dienoyl-CoA reductase n=1 Tax=Amycolatopsis jejuensis TaxID=330084 RepID=UPI000525CB15|nr:NADPH-dependent 2,4-dienoyl-CoA reductase [Amycolatopsis jejuensis]
MEQFARLLEPITIGSLRLPNRMVMGGMHTRLDTLDRPVERQMAFFARRARGGAALLITNGIAPNAAGRMDHDSAVLNEDAPLDDYRRIAAAVHDAGGRIAVQLLHAGRYGKHEDCVGPSSAQARINRFSPRRLSAGEVWQTVADFGVAARLAREAGFDGVEVMAGEGYLINEFLAGLTNDRDDEFGGSFENRTRLAREIIAAMRAAVGAGFPIIWRMSAIDLVEGGFTAAETVEMARIAEAAGADALDVGVGWHESRIPTIAASVPRAAWAFAGSRIKRAVTIPVIGAIRVNKPEVGEQLLADGHADLVLMARPFLADPDFPLKVKEGRAEDINTCIACNQSCLDRMFSEQPVTCLVNPFAGRELELVSRPAVRPKTVAVVGAGPAGLTYAINAAERGHQVVLFEQDDRIGGQLNLARVVPGKSEFDEMLRYFRVRLAKLGVDVRLATRATVERLAADRFDSVVVAAGVRPRIPAIEGVGHPMVHTYDAVLSGEASAGRRVAIVGAGGVGFDVAEFLAGDPRESVDPQAFYEAWGIDPEQQSPGGVTAPRRRSRPREITMFQRKNERMGAGLGKTTGWILKSKLRDAGVRMVVGASYDRIDDAGLHYTVDGESRCAGVDSVVLCAGQESQSGLYDELLALGIKATLIGGANVAAELDAARAIEEATYRALEL